MTLGKDGHIATIGVRERLASHKLIEEFMVLANVAAAQALEQRHAACLYRVHDQPDLAKLEALREFLGTLGIKVPTGQRLRPADLNRVLHEVADKPVSQLVSQTVLRSQSQAVYSPDNLGHFGLALARYAHFTSPIRRFPDLIVHRALIAAYGLGEGGLSAEDKGRFTEFGEHLSMCERRAVAAERGAMDRYVAAFMAGHVGAIFPGRVNGVTRFGLFATLEGTGADGLDTSGVIKSAQAINKGDYQAAKDAIANATAVSGTTGEVLAPLQQRRKEEAELFASMGMNPGGGSAKPEEKA